MISNQSLSLEDKSVWREIRKELEEIRITIAAFNSDKAFIIRWFETSVVSGRFEEEHHSDGVGGETDDATVPDTVHPDDGPEDSFESCVVSTDLDNSDSARDTARELFNSYSSTTRVVYPDQVPDKQFPSIGVVDPPRQQRP